MIIALSAFKQSGKDTVADYLVQTNGFTRVSFADPLKDKVAAQFSIPRADLDNPDKKESPILRLPVNPQDDYSRMIAKFMVKEFRTENGKIAPAFISKTNKGSFWDYESKLTEETLYWTPRALAILIGSTCRSVDSSYWVKQAIEKAKGIQNVVISDLRYKSESQQLTMAFGDELTTIRINRFDSSPSQDPSELDLVDYPHNFTMENKGTKEELFAKVEGILKNKKAPRT
jgi:hypothetical protein